MTPGRKAYEAYSKHHGIAQSWFALSSNEQDAWERAAKTVREDCYVPGEVVCTMCPVCDYDVEMELLEK